MNRSIATLNIAGRQHSYIDCGEGPLVVLLHGFPDIADTWTHQIDALCAAGYRCVAPTLRGYECSSIAKDYFILDSVNDIRELQQSLNVESFHLIGHDWGAIIAYAFAAKYPQALSSLSTLAIPHLSAFKTGLKEIAQQRKNSAYIGLFQLPLIAQWWCRRNNFAYIDRLWQRWSPDWQYQKRDIDPVKHQLRQAGVLKATLAYYQHLYRPGRAPSQLASVQPLTVPCMVLAGENDGCMDVGIFEILEREKPFKSDYEIHIISNAGHFMHREKAQHVNQLLQQWLDKYS